MKWLIASDIHGSAAHAEKLVRAFEREGAERLLLLGDVLYHGPRNALPEGYGPMDCARILNVLSDKITCIHGNCDAEVDQMVLDFDISAPHLMLELDGLAVFAVHGHRIGPSAPPPFVPFDVMLSGHTHVPAWQEREGARFFNPGSTTIPKSGSACSYMTYENRVFTWKTLDGEIYHEERL